MSLATVLRILFELCSRPGPVARGLKAQHLAWVGFFASDHLASRSFGHVDERFKTFRLLRIEIERVDLTKMMASLSTFLPGHQAPKRLKSSRVEPSGCVCEASLPKDSDTLPRFELAV